MRTLTARLTLTVVGLVALMALVLGASTTLVMRHTLDNRLDRDVRAALDNVLTGQRGPGMMGMHPTRGDSLIDLRNQAPGTLVSVFAGELGDETVVVGDHPGDVRRVDAEVHEKLGMMEADDQVDTVRLPTLGRYRVASASVRGVTVSVGLPTQAVAESIASLVAAELALGALAVAVAGALAVVLVRRRLEPLRAVGETARTVATLPLASGAVDLGTRVPDGLVDDETEVGRVAGALNAMLDHVETSLEARQRSEQQVRQFVADASHELRTPLATIAGYTELARRQPGEAETALSKVEAEAGRMTGLVEDLLLLARLDAGRPLAAEPVDLSLLLLEAVNDQLVVDPDRQWRVVLPEAPITLTGDPARLHQVVTNLLRNASRHTPAGTTVTVTGRSDGFGVHDDGPGFAPGLADRAFERFTRGDAARRRDRAGEGGAGLGLSLVDAIVTAHGGSVSLSSVPGDTTISVRLPRT